jgi:hypothetical protein
MEYTLALLTHGDAPLLDVCLDSFSALLNPAPEELVCVIDGLGRLPPTEPFGAWFIKQSQKQEGFCSATRRLWSLAADSSSPFVFYLENDFVLLRSLDLEGAIAVLDANPMLSQMQFMREPVNREERQAGGVIPKHVQRGDEFAVRDGWIENRAYVITTNPSLMRCDFMVENPWPEYDSECEGRFGIDLASKGFSAGIWGDGTPLVRHVGRRRGRGY